MTSFVRFLAASGLALALGCGAPDGAVSLDDPSADLLGAPCLSTAQCGAGEVCTTEDGVCDPPPGCKPGAACPAVCAGTCRPRVPAPGPNRCRTDADCRAFSDYCVGCDCRALSVCQPDPKCPTPGVQCFVDPCHGEEAFCSAGACALRPARQPCPIEKCGPRPAAPRYVCPDGKAVAGPTGRCLLQPAGSCAWELASCPSRAVCLL